MSADDAMLPLDMPICECLHKTDNLHAISDASILLTCDALLENNVDQNGVDNFRPTDQRLTEGKTNLVG
jgi:hypothetical protein